MAAARRLRDSGVGLPLGITARGLGLLDEVVDDLLLAFSNIG
jgi:hypothetical protein